MNQLSEYSHEDILQANLSSIADLLEKDWDWLLCLCGDERVGKSTLAIQIGKAIGERVGRPFGMRNCVFDWNYLRKTALELPNRSPIFYSESRILSRERLSQFNIAVMSALSVIGYKNHFIMINFPQFRELDPYLKNHRIKTRIEVKSYMGERGMAIFYARVKKDHPDHRGRTVWWDYAFTYHFDAISKEKGWDKETIRLWKDYLKRDQKEKERLLGGEGLDPRSESIIRLRKKGYTQYQIGDMWGIAQPRVSQIEKELREQGFFRELGTE